MDNAPDWTLLRSFLAVAEAGSLSGAARQLGSSQPTLSRHIRELEACLSISLFTRIPRGLELTEAGAALIAPARAMREAAAQLSLAAEGRAGAVTGTVRLTASRVVAHYILPGMLAELRQAEPGIEIELIASDASENLLFREADIALRMYRPTQLDLIATRIADFPTGLYAAKSYLDRVGRPQTPKALLALDIVGFLTSDMIVRIMHNLGLAWKREDFPLRCDDQLVYWNLVRAGCGIGGMQRHIADADPLVERVAPEIALPNLPIWLTAPEALKRNPRIRLVFDFLAAAFKSLPQG